MIIMIITPKERCRFESAINRHGPAVSESALLKYPELNGTRCHLWTKAITRAGYGVIGIKAKNIYAHRLSFELYYGVELQNCGLHKCDIRHCVNPLHIFDGTFKENSQDMVSKGRDYRGTGRAKLTYGDAEYIKSHYIKGRGPYDKGNAAILAGRFGVDIQTISRTVRKR